MKTEAQFDDDTISTRSANDEELGEKDKEDENSEDEGPPQQRVDDWDGPDDPENPHNWPMALRVYHSIIPALFGFGV